MGETEPAADLEDAAFFRRFRLRRIVIAAVIGAVLVAAYAYAVRSYSSSIPDALPQQSPPNSGVSVVLVPDAVLADDQALGGNLLLFAAPELLDEQSRLTTDVTVSLQPALAGARVVFPAGSAPSPQRVSLPAPGVIQEYPFDDYGLSVTVTTEAGDLDAGFTPLQSTASLFFRVPGWSYDASQTLESPALENHVLAGTVSRSGSTKSIAVLLLALMVVLAFIAILVVNSTTRGRMRLELAVAGWLTAMLFALIPIRGFFPGSPPLGSWMDILVFFWVELLLMICVAATAGTIVFRARDENDHRAS